jgi:hypothetical protein
MEFIAGIFTGYLLSYTGIFFLFVIALLSDIFDWSGFAIFTLWLTALCSVLFFNVHWTIVAQLVVAYVLTGVIWSVWRYRAFVNKRIKEIKEYVPSGNVETYRANEARMLQPKYQTNKILYWMTAWPISFISSFVGDLIVLIKDSIQTYLRGLYLAVYSNATSDIKKDFE